MALFNGINVVSIAVPDLQAARLFYAQTLELGQPVYDLPDAGWIEFSAGSGHGNIAITTQGYESSRTQPTTVVLSTEDCNQTYQRLKARGVRCDEPVTFPGYVVFCTFYDPFGNRLQMCSPAPEAS